MCCFKARHDSTSSRKLETVFITLCAFVESLQNSGDPVSFSSSESFTSLPAKSKTHHELLSQVIRGLQAI